MAKTAEVEIDLVRDGDGWRVATLVNGEEIHSTITYPDMDFARLAAAEIEERVRKTVSALPSPLGKDK